MRVAVLKPPGINDFRRLLLIFLLKKQISRFCYIYFCHFLHVWNVFII